MIYTDYQMHPEKPSNPPPLPGRAKKRESELEFEVERLLMITEAMWSLLSQHHGYTDEDLLRRVYEIDAEDGQVDGQKERKPASKCVSCNRTMMRRRPRCIYCGALSARGVFER